MSIGRYETGRAERTCREIRRMHYRVTQKAASSIPNPSGAWRAHRSGRPCEWSARRPRHLSRLLGPTPKERAINWLQALWISKLSGGV